MIAWAGIFSLDSGINFLVGFAAGADYSRDVCGGSEELRKRLQEILGRKVNVMAFKQDDDYDYVYGYMVALLTAETIWGNPLWKHSGREVAKRLLREGYETSKKALQVASRLEESLPSSRAEFESPKNKTLRLSILEGALLVITTVQVAKNPICADLQRMMEQLLAKEDAIRAAIEGEVEDLRDIWNVLSDSNNVDTLGWMTQKAEGVFSRAGLKP